jgi:transposase
MRVRDSLKRLIRFGGTMTINVTRTDFSADELRRKASRARDGNEARRLLALALILEGASRSRAARLSGMDRQSLCDWVHRYNAEGIAGLRDRPRTGRKPLLNEDQLAGLGRMVETQPDPRQDGVVRWRCIDLKAKIAAEFGVEISERSVARLLKARGFRRLSARPRHLEADEASQQTSRLIFPGSYATSFPGMPKPSPSKSGFRTRPA